MAEVGAQALGAPPVSKRVPGGGWPRPRAQGLGPAGLPSEVLQGGLGCGERQGWTAGHRGHRGPCWGQPPSSPGIPLSPCLLAKVRTECSTTTLKLPPAQASGVSVSPEPPQCSSPAAGVPGSPSFSGPQLIQRDGRGRLSPLLFLRLQQGAGGWSSNRRSPPARGTGTSMYQNEVSRMG